VRNLLLGVALLSLAGPASAEWWEAKTDHFIVDSESSSKDAHDFALKLERYDEALRGLQGIGEDRNAVDRFHQAAIAAGGKDNGTPGERKYHDGYYGAFVLDPDGNNIEVVFHGPAKKSAESVKVSF